MNQGRRQRLSGNTKKDAAAKRGVGNDGTGRGTPAAQRAGQHAAGAASGPRAARMGSTTGVERPSRAFAAWADDVSADSSTDPQQDPPRAWSRAEVRALLSRSRPTLSPGVVVLAQYAVAVVGAVVAWALSGRAMAGWSALVGGLLVALPNSVMWYGIRYSALRRFAAAALVWEVVKLGLTLVLFAGVSQAARTQGWALEWLPLLLTLLVALKMVWLALLPARRV